MKKSLTALVGTLCLLVWGGAVPAQSPTLYTIADVYYYLVDGTEAAEGGHSLEPPSGATPGDTRFKTLKELYEDAKALFDQCDALPSEVTAGKTFFSFQTSTWGVQSGTLSPSRALLVTGQKVSHADYDDGWYERGLDYDYTDNGDGTVTDNVTGLMWPQDGNGAGCMNGSRPIWPDAVSWADGLTFAGYSDWRLPNIKELDSLMVLDEALYALGKDAIKEPPFTNTPVYHFSSTTTPSNTDRLLGCYFGLGIPYYDNGNKSTSTFWVRAVRDAD